MAFDINGGWIPANEEWTYDSVDGPTFVFTVPGDVTGKYSLGMKVKGTNNSTQFMGFITKLAYSTGTTTVTCYGGTDFTIEDSAITLPFYSTAKAPFGFPIDPAKWTEITTYGTNALQFNPTTDVWYNPGSTNSQLSVPIGSWYLSFQTPFYCNIWSGPSVSADIAFSTSTSSATDTDMNAKMTTDGATRLLVFTCREKILTVTSKTLYYLICKTLKDDTQNIGYINEDFGYTSLRAVCAYL